MMMMMMIVYLQNDDFVCPNGPKEFWDSYFICGNLNHDRISKKSAKKPVLETQLFAAASDIYYIPDHVAVATIALFVVVDGRLSVISSLKDTGVM